MKEYCVVFDESFGFIVQIVEEIQGSGCIVLSVFNNIESALDYAEKLNDDYGK